jgi:hypothetical protein
LPVHRQVGRRRLPREIADLHHAVAGEYQLVELIGALQLHRHLAVLLTQHLVGELQLAAEVAVQAGQFAAFQSAPDEQPELVRLPGLGDDLVDRSLVDRADHLVGVAALGEQNANGFRVGDADLAEELHAGHVGQHLITEDQIALFGSQQFECGAP